MRIFILDIDGTMMLTHEVDNRCYWNAVSEVFGLDLGVLDLAGFTHVTDSGIFNEWCFRELGRLATESETAAVRTRFLALTQVAAAEQPQAFTAMAGLEHWLEECVYRGFALAVATGGWSHTAAFKIENAGLDRFAMPLATSDDSTKRTVIMQSALNQLGLGQVSPEAITYVGDGPWDHHCASELDWNFIGIASGQRAEQLHRSGARNVHSDFTSIRLD